MQIVRKPLIMIFFAAMAGAMAQFIAPAPDMCFAAGSVTYRLTPRAHAADYRVAIDNAAESPDLRVRLVDRVEAADFALTDDTGAMIGSPCRAIGRVRSVSVVPAGAPSDIVIAVSEQPDDVDFSLFVHSARVSHADAAALFALVRREPDAPRASGGDHVAEVR